MKLRIVILSVVLVVLGAGADLDPCDYQNLTETLHALANRHTKLARLVSIGASPQGRELWTMILGENVELRPILTPQVKLVGNINGYSGPACLILLAFVEELLEGYQVMDSVERRVLQTLEIQVLFNMNPDAYAKATLGDCNHSSLETGMGVRRLNEDFRKTFPENEEEYLAEQEDAHRRPETRAVINWTLDNHFVISLSFVSGFKALVVPFDEKVVLNSHEHAGGKEVETPDADIFSRLATSYLAAMSWQNSLGWQCPSLNRTFEHGFTTGAKWYSVKGTMLDFNYIYGGAFEIMVGLSCCRNEQDPREIRNLWLKHRKGIYRILREADGGIKGQVFDGVTGDVLGGVRMNRVDRRHNMEPMTWITTQQGEFWRPLPPGHHIIHVSKEGYEDERIEVEVSRDGPAVLQIELQPVEKMKNDIEDSTTSMTITETLRSEVELTTEMSHAVEEEAAATTEEMTRVVKGKDMDRFQSGFSAIWGHLRAASGSPNKKLLFQNHLLLLLHLLLLHAAIQHL